MLSVAVINGLGAFMGPSAARMPEMTGRPVVGRMPTVVAAIDTGVTTYVHNLERKVYLLADKLGVAAPHQCDGDSCYDLSTYIEVLEEAALTLEAQSKFSEQNAVMTARPDDIPDTVGVQGTLTLYTQKLESKVQALANELGVQAPQQCIGDQCMSLEAYVEILEDAIATFERKTQGGSTMAALDGCTADKGAIPASSLTAYTAKLEAEASFLSQRLGVPMPQQCVGDACMSVEAYVELLHETVSTLKMQWQAQGSDTW